MIRLTVFSFLASIFLETIAEVGENNKNIYIFGLDNIKGEKFKIPTDIDLRLCTCKLISKPEFLQCIKNSSFDEDGYSSAYIFNNSSSVYGEKANNKSVTRNDGDKADNPKLIATRFEGREEVINLEGKTNSTLSSNDNNVEEKVSNVAKNGSESFSNNASDKTNNHVKTNRQKETKNPINNSNYGVSHRQYSEKNNLLENKIHLKNADAIILNDTENNKPVKVKTIKQSGSNNTLAEFIDNDKTYEGASEISVLSRKAQEKTYIGTVNVKKNKSETIGTKQKLNHVNETQTVTSHNSSNVIKITRENITNRQTFSSTQTRPKIIKSKINAIGIKRSNDLVHQFSSDDISWENESTEDKNNNPNAYKQIKGSVLKHTHNETLSQETVSKMFFDSGEVLNTENSEEKQPLNNQNEKKINFEDDVKHLGYMISEELGNVTRECDPKTTKPIKWCIHKPDKDSVAWLSTPDIIKKYKYPAQSHTVTTEDGYILQVHRIPHGRNINSSGVNPGNKVVLLLHGLLASSASFVDLGPSRGLGFILADEGFDVWLGNFRGNTYSFNHVNGSSPEYWDFSMHEMGRYDIPAMIDLVLRVTQLARLFVVAYSTGATSTYVMASIRSEYISKMILLVAIAPVVPAPHLDTTAKDEAGRLGKKMLWLLERKDGHQFAPNYSWLAQLEDLVCRNETRLNKICNSSRPYGFNSKTLTEEDFKVVSAHFPAGTSLKFMVHLAQMLINSKFEMFDYGSANEGVYGYKTPPTYDLNRGMPLVSVVYSMDDNMAPDKDVSDFVRDFPMVKEKYRVNVSGFSHMDFLWAEDVKEIVYTSVIDTMRKILRYY